MITKQDKHFKETADLKARTLSRLTVVDWKYLAMLVSAYSLVFAPSPQLIHF